MVWLTEPRHLPYAVTFLSISIQTPIPAPSSNPAMRVFKPSSTSKSRSPFSRTEIRRVCRAALFGNTRSNEGGDDTGVTVIGRVSNRVPFNRSSSLRSPF